MSETLQLPQEQEDKNSESSVYDELSVMQRGQQQTDKPEKHVGQETVKANIEALMATELGPSIVDAYKALVAERPDLADIPITVIPESEKSGNAHRVDKETGQSTVRLHMDRQLFESHLKQDGFDIRYKRFIDFLSGMGKTLDVETLVKIVMWHEFGHAADFRQLRAEHPDLSIQDLTALKIANRQKEIDSLPLKGPTLGFLEWYTARTEREKAQIRREEGTPTQAEFDALLRKNTAAYVDLPSETVADDFALEQLRKQLG